MRSRRRRLIAAGLAATATLGLSGVPALADVEGGAGGTTDGYIDRGGNPTVEAGEGARSPGGPGGDGSASDCEWHVVVEDDSNFPVHDLDGQRTFSETGRWVGRFCDGAQIMVGDTFAVPEGNGAPVDPAAVARRARESVTIAAPLVATSPSADRELYTQVPTWLWLEGEAWGTHSATASAGGVSATVTASPLRTEWTMGDGHQVTCEGPGVPWQKGMEEDDTYCSHTYRSSSAGRPGGTYTVTVTVHYSVAWTSNVGEGGELAGVARSGSRPVRVGEIQAVRSG